MIHEPARRTPHQLLRALLSITALAGFATAGQAEVTISDQPTRAMKCAAGVCAPKKAKANLNVTDLADMLAAGDITVMSDNAALDIRFTAPLSWTSTTRLTLDSYRSIFFEQPIAVTGKGSLSISVDNSSDDVGFWFKKNGHIQFWDLRSSLVINGSRYSLVKSVKQLAKAAAQNPSGLYALAISYDASHDGTYSHSPVSFLDGMFEGLGNQIENLSVDDHDDQARVGLFSETTAFALRDLNLVAVSISAKGGSAYVGGLAGVAHSIVEGCSVSGSVSGGEYTGGLVGEGGDEIVRSYSSAKVQSINSKNSFDVAGGLAGGTSNGVFYSYATGSATGGDNSFVGGLIGIQESGAVAFSYSTASAIGGFGANVGGLIGGTNDRTIQSYAIGAVSGGDKALIGGLVGSDTGTYDSTYWNLRTSGTHQGTGTGDVGGITGLTTAQFKSALPTGFDPNIWGQKRSINKSYPYLLANPPPQ